MMRNEKDSLCDFLIIGGILLGTPFIIAIVGLYIEWCFYIVCKIVGVL